MATTCLQGCAMNEEPRCYLAVKAVGWSWVSPEDRSRGVLARTPKPFYEEPLYASELVTGKHYAVREQLTLKQLVATLRQLAKRSTDRQPRT